MTLELERSARSNLIDKKPVTSTEIGVRDALTMHLRDITKAPPLLSPAEEISLSTKYRLKGSKAAQHRLLESNLGLVVDAVMKYEGRGMPLEDLIQEGYLGLYRAVDKYDPEKGWLFSTYAYWWIRQAISEAISYQSRIIKVPREVAALDKKIHRVEEQLTITTGQAPSTIEIQKVIPTLTEAQILLVRQARQASKPVSLDAPILNAEGDQALTSAQTLAGPDNTDEQATRGLVRGHLDEVLDSLSPREKRVLVLRFGLDDGRDRELDEIGKEMGVSGQRIGQIIAKVFKQLRQSDASRILKDCL